MADLIHEQMAPLAWDSDGMPFQWPSGTVALKIRVYTGQRGRPPNFWDEHGVAHLPPDATMADLRAKVKNECRDYRLYPVTATGEELEPVACIKLVSVPDAEQITVLDDDRATARPPLPTPAWASVQSSEPSRPTSSGGPSSGYQPSGVDLMYMFGRFMDQQEKRDAQMTQMMQTLVESTASVQRSTADMIKVSNSTVQVASGLDALARLPESPTIDEEVLAEKLSELIEEAETDEEPQKPGIGESLGSLMNGPLGKLALGVIGGYTQGMQRAMNARVKAEVAAARAQEARADAIRSQAEAVKAKAEREKAEAEAETPYWDEEYEEESAEESPPAASAEGTSSAPTQAAKVPPSPGQANDETPPAQSPEKLPSPAHTAKSMSQAVESPTSTQAEETSSPPSSQVFEQPITANVSQVASIGETSIPPDRERMATDHPPASERDAPVSAPASTDPSEDTRT